MKSMNKYLLGIITIYPIVYIAFFIIYFLSMMNKMFNSTTMDGTFLFNTMPYIFFFHILAMIVSMFLLVFYIVHVVKNKRIKDDMRIIWILIIFFGSMIAMPIYWYLYILKEDKISEREGA